MATYTISHLAYIKVALHAAKYPHRQVNGVLLGNASADRTQVEVTGAIPLLHHWTSLSPSMEIGLDLVSLTTLRFCCEVRDVLPRMRMNMQCLCVPPLCNK